MIKYTASADISFQSTHRSGLALTRTFPCITVCGPHDQVRSFGGDQLQDGNTKSSCERHAAFSEVRDLNPHASPIICSILQARDLNPQVTHVTAQKLRARDLNPQVTQVTASILGARDLNPQLEHMIAQKLRARDLISQLAHMANSIFVARGSNLHISYMVHWKYLSKTGIRRLRTRPTAFCGYVALIGNAHNGSRHLRRHVTVYNADFGHVTTRISHSL